MKRLFKLDKIVKYVLVWMVAWTLFFIIKYLGTADLPMYEMVLSIRFPSLVFNVIVMSVFIGVPYSVVDSLLDHPMIRKKSYFQIISLKTISQIIITFCSYFILIKIVQKRADLHEYTNLDEIYKQIVFSDLTILVLFYSLVISTLIHVFQLLERKVGANVLLNLLIGKYHFPREEKRIFMFLDLRSSTTLAEKLGHIKFSSLIQDCFNDLTDAIISHKVEVYQYVGDEAVLTWRVKDGLTNNNCLQTYFTFQNKLDKKKNYYLSKYDTTPFFKAGVHFGLVTVTEVGVIKREIAYHSDVLNTAARIQSKCNEFNAPLLISEDLYSELKNMDNFDFQSIGGITLRGKNEAVNIYSCKAKS